MVSVILPIYKEKIEWIQLSVESILSQTYTDFELILINDNPERKENITLIKEYEYKDKRVRGVFHDENMKLPKSLNDAITIAQGEYIARMDADDISMPNRFEEQVNFLDNNPNVGVVGTFAIAIDESGKDKYKLNLYEHNEELKALTLFSVPFVHPSVMIRRDLLLSNFYNINCTVGQDRELWCKLKSQTQFYNIPKILLKYRKSSQQAFQKAGSKKTEQSLKYIANKIIEYWGINHKFDDLYFKIDTLIPVEERESDEFFLYLMKIYKNDSIMRYFILKKYMGYIIKVKGIQKLYFNSLVRTYPFEYLKAVSSLFIRLIRKHSI